MLNSFTRDRRRMIERLWSCSFSEFDLTVEAFATTFS